MKRFPLYLIAPFLILGCKNAVAMTPDEITNFVKTMVTDECKSCVETMPVSDDSLRADLSKPAVQHDLDAIDGEFVRCLRTIPTPPSVHTKTADGKDVYSEAVWSIRPGCAEKHTDALTSVRFRYDVSCPLFTSDLKFRNPRAHKNLYEELSTTAEIKATDAARDARWDKNQAILAKAAARVEAMEKTVLKPYTRCVAAIAVSDTDGKLAALTQCRKQFEDAYNFESLGLTRSGDRR